jgi:hypothetical protein
VTNVKKLAFETVAGAFILALLFALFGCATQPPDPCQIHPTKTNAAGEWVEGDGEPMDDDPCDSDDVGGDTSHGKTKFKKPTSKKTTKTGGR